MVEEKFRKLAPIDRKRSDLAWLFYLSGELEERKSAEDLVDVLLFQQAGKGYRKEVFLDPPSPFHCWGEYWLGDVVYPPRRKYCSFGLREEEWIRHVLIVGMTDPLT